MIEVTNNSNSAEVLLVAVCAVTGVLGCAILEQVERINAQNDHPQIHVRGLTRDPDSPQAQELSTKYAGHLTLVQVDYDSPKSVRKALKGCQAMLLKLPIPMTQTNTYYERLINCAIQVEVSHIIYASHVACEQDQTSVPHWNSARHTEGYLAIRQDEVHPKISYHVLRFAHLNEYLLVPPQAPVDGWIAYPWQPGIRVHTASAKDGARVACKLFFQPAALKNGTIINVVTEYKNPHEMAQYIALATGSTTQAYKGPASLVTLGQLTGYRNRSMAALGEFMERQWTKDSVKATKTTLQAFLKEELEEEPLETLEAFVNRKFNGSNAN